MSTTQKLEEIGCLFPAMAAICSVTLGKSVTCPLPEWIKNASLPKTAQDLYAEIAFLLHTESSKQQICTHNIIKQHTGHRGLAQGCSRKDLPLTLSLTCTSSSKWYSRKYCGPESTIKKSNFYSRETKRKQLSVNSIRWIKMYLFPINLRKKKFISLILY